jgi:transposase
MSLCQFLQSASATPVENLDPAVFHDHDSTTAFSESVTHEIRAESADDNVKERHSMNPGPKRLYCRARLAPESLRSRLRLRRLQNIVTTACACRILCGMGHPAGVKRDRVKLERRRLDAAQLLKKGVSEAEVARRLGVHRQSVNRWAQQLAAGGRAALKRAPRTGRPPHLSPTDRRRVERGLKRGPEALGYRTSLWTAWRVADLIERECGVKYSTVHAWRVLRALGWTPQRPAGRAVERNEAAIAEWKRVRWPKLKRTPNDGPTRSSWSTKAD